MKQHAPLPLSLAAILLMLPALTVAGTARPDAAAIASYGKQLLADTVDENGPGIAVLVARGDEILYRDARGRANIEQNVPLSADNIFRIGSVTKQFAAAALLKLVDDGKVALTDPLSKFLPDYPNGESITVAQLLNHTSGIQSYTNIPGYMDQDIRRDLGTDDLIAVFKDKPVEFAPGERWNYNNSGYVLVGAVIEKASGMAWYRWTEESLLKPLQLSHTHYGARRDIVPDMANGYSMDGERVSTMLPLSMTQPHAAGALLSSVDDLLRWNRALHEGKVLSADSYRRMITPEGKAGEDSMRYGYGIQAGTVRGHAILEHGGGIYGFISHLMYMPDDDVTVAVLRNADGEGGQHVQMISRKLAAFAVGDAYPENTPIDVPEAELKTLEGVYRLDKDNARTLRIRNGKLTSQRSGGAPFNLTPVGGDTFAFEESFARLFVMRGTDDKPTAVRFFPDGEGDGEIWTLTDESTEERAEISMPRDAQARLVGDYVSDQISFKVFFDDADTLRVQVPGQPAFTLKAETATRWFITEVDATFEFEPADGTVRTATLLQGPTRVELKRNTD